MKKQYYQNDFTDLKGVVAGGCLFMSLLDIISEDSNHEFIKKEIKDIYKRCNEAQYLGTSKSRSEDGAYCWDHIGILNTASRVIGNKENWEYSARIYTKEMGTKGYTSFINNQGYLTDKDNYIIFQVRTTEVSGHFKRFSYDPWKEGSREISLKSTRYYKKRK